MDVETRPIEISKDAPADRRLRAAEARTAIRGETLIALALAR
jgi:hypothetical protein